MKQQQRLLILLFALCLGVANAWAETATFTKVTATPTDWSGEYIIVYEAGKVIFDGSLTTLDAASNTQSVTIANNAIIVDDKYAFTIAKNGSSFSIQSKSGYYIGRTANSNGFDANKATKYDHTLSYSAGNVEIKSSAGAILRYNKNSGQTRFRYYKSSSSSNQQAIQLYKKEEGSCTKPTFAIEGKTITLEEAELFDLSTLTTNKGGSTGAITYSCSDATVEIADNLCTITTPGTYTITATMAADDTYCEATTTFTITIPCTPLTTPTGLNASAQTYSTATLTWGNVTNATKYQVTLTPAGGTAKTDEATGTTYSATDLSPETTYTWTVKAIGDGTTYCDSEESTSGTFTTPAKPKYTITWSTPAGTKTTQVTQDEKIGTLPADPKAPIGCSEKVFMGWSATNIGTTGTNVAPTFITAETVPSANTTYYAIFATATESSTGGSKDIVFNVKDIASNNNWSNSKQYSSYTIDPITITYSGSGNDGKYYSSNYSWRIYNGGSIVISGSTILGVTSTPSKTFAEQSDGTWKYTATATVQFTQFTITIAAGGTTYTDYVTNCAEPTEPIIAADPTSIDFGTLLQGETNPTSQNLTITGKNLTSNITYTQPTHFTVLGSLSGQGGTLTITPKTNEAGRFTEDLTLTSTGATNVTVPLSVVITPTYTIQWSVCGDIDATLTQRVAQDVAITIPEGPAKEGLVFCGWTTEANKNYSSTDQAPDMISGTITATADATYYAVFAQSKVGNTGYTKVTEARDNYAGKYLIVSEDNNVAFNGSLTTLDATNNNVSVTITDGKIASNATLDAAVFTIAKTGDAYTIQSQSGKFIGRSATSNGMNESTTTQYTNTITLTNGSMVIEGSGGATLRYNAASNQKRFRYFQYATTGDPIQLYEKADLFNYNTNCAAVEIYSISASSTTGGEITVSHTNAIAGEHITVTATPEARYRLSQIVYNDGTDHTVTIADNKGSFTMPAANVTVTATFVPISVTAVAVSPTTVNLRVGQSQKLTLTITPEDAFNPSVQWQSSNATVATVSVTAEGTFVVAHSVGTATLTATTQDGSNLTATVNATIIEANTYTYIDALHGNATQVHAGKHTVPAFSNQREGEGMECRYLHYHFIGWTKTIINTDTNTKPADLLTPGDTVDANADSTPQTYYAVWAEATTITK